MGSSQRRKPGRQPATVTVRGGHPIELWQPGPTGEANPEEELVIPLIAICVAVLRRSKVGEVLAIEEGPSGLVARGSLGVVGGIPPHYQEILRQGRVTRGILASVEPDRPGAKMVVRRGT